MYGILIDVTKCIGCEKCVAACTRRNGFDPWQADRDRAVTADGLSEHRVCTVVKVGAGRFARKSCMHCVDPTCASACPVGALTKTAVGPVLYDRAKCIGCRYCMLACPYQVPRYQWSKLAPFVKKCDMCMDRVKAGKATACAEACPAQATIFGNRDELIREAWSRIRSDSSYVSHIYGVEELGGACVLLISDVPFDKLGFKPAPTGVEPMPSLTASALGDSPKVVIMGGTILSALYWVTQRRREVALAEAKEKAAIDQIKAKRS